MATRPPPTPPIAEVYSPPPTHHLILVAGSPLRAGTLLKPEDLVTLDASTPPLNALDDTQANRAALLGAMLRRSLSQGDALLGPDVMRPGDHGFLAAVLGQGLRAATIAVDNVSGSAGLIWPGDHVDLILTQSLDDPALPLARKIAAETMLADVRVIAIDQLLARGVAPAADVGAGRTVTLEVTPTQAERIAVASRLGRLSLAVRSAENSSGTPAALPATQTTWGGDVSPALANPPPLPAKQAGATLHLYQGSNDGKEFRF